MSVIIKGGSSSDLATVKPASTAPLATDPSLVVTMSPNSPATTVSGSISVSNFPAVQPIDHIDTAPATQNITTQDTGSTTTAVANGQNFITGTPTAGSVASFTVSSVDSVEVLVTGTWTGTLSSEFSIDSGVTWFTRGLKQAGSSYFSSTFTLNFAGGANITGATNYRIRSTAAMTGTATVKIITTLNAASITISNPLTLRDSVVQSITNTIKPASTASIATDTALVTTLSPNTPLPAGTNAIGSITNTSFIATQATGTNLHTVIDSGTVTANQGTPGTAANSWFTKVSDGTNFAGIAPAVTPAGAPQPALVVGLSPNSPLPTGTNSIGSIANTSFIATQATGTNLHTVIDSGTITTVSAVTAITNALPTGTNTIGSVNIAASATSTVTNVAAAVTSTTLLAANTSRKGASFYSVAGSATLFIKLGSGATTTTSFTVSIAPGGFYELTLPSYDGIITGIWSAATGSVNVTELT
jgi:hypothetical protein